MHIVAAGLGYCRVFSVIFRCSAGTRATSVVAYSDFTSKSPDYVLSKAGLVSNQTKPNYHCLNSAILQDRHKVAIFL